VARRFSLPPLRRAENLAVAWGAAAVRGLRLSDLRDRWDDFPGHPQTADALVSGDLVGYEPEDRRQRHAAATGLGAGEL
jgi:hypothetical protein